MNKKKAYIILWSQDRFVLIWDPMADICEYVRFAETRGETRLDQSAGILLKWLSEKWAESYRIHIVSQTDETEFSLGCQEFQMTVYNLIPSVEYS